MSNGYIQLTPDSSGKRLRTRKVTEDGNETHDEVIELSNSSGTVVNPATEDGNIANIKSGIDTINSLVPSTYDYIELTYSGSNVTQVVYKTGGASGTVVSTLTLAYTGSNVTSITKT